MVFVPGIKFSPRCFTEEREASFHKNQRDFIKPSCINKTPFMYLTQISTEKDQLLRRKGIPCLFFCTFFLFSLSTVCESSDELLTHFDIVTVFSMQHFSANVCHHDAQNASFITF